MVEGRQYGPSEYVTLSVVLDINEKKPWWEKMTFVVRPETPGGRERLFEMIVTGMDLVLRSQTGALCLIRNRHIAVASITPLEKDTTAEAHTVEAWEPLRGKQ